MRRIWAPLLLVGACAGVAALAGLAYAEGLLRVNDPDRAQYPLGPIVYLTPEAHAAFFSVGEVGHPFWIRSLWGEPPEGWTFWQFANRARVRGIRTAVDLNAFHSADPARLAAL